MFSELGTRHDRRGTRPKIALALVLFSAGAPAPAAAAVKLQPVARSTQPVLVTAPRGDKRLFVVDRLGRVDIVRRGRIRGRPFLDLRRVVELDEPRRDDRDQGGLLSLAFAPDYKRSGRFYVLYTHEDGFIHLDEARRAAGNRSRANPASRRTVLTVGRLTRNDIGGHVAFGPDGLLYLGLGYGANPNESQDLGSLRGKLLRIDPRRAGSAPYTVPPSNPFVTTAGARPEVFAFGLRVPWRFAFDRRTGDLVLPDVGESAYEEANFLRRGRGAGANFGWPVYEGRRRMTDTRIADPVFPALTRRHGQSTCAIIGGPIVRDRRLRSLYGRFAYADLCTGQLRSARLAPGRARGGRREGRVNYPVSFGEDGRGRVYVVSLFGRIYRLARR